MLLLLLTPASLSRVLSALTQRYALNSWSFGMSFSLDWERAIVCRFSIKDLDEALFIIWLPLFVFVTFCLFTCSLWSYLMISSGFICRLSWHILTMAASFHTSSGTWLSSKLFSVLDPNVSSSHEHLLLGCPMVAAPWFQPWKLLSIRDWFLCFQRFLSLYWNWTTT